jgi:hypothetical protein
MHYIRGAARGIGLAGFCLVVLALPAAADRMTSTNYTLNGNADSSFGGQGSSTNYGAFTTGGEAIVGQGTSGSYIMGQGTTAKLQQAMQLTAQPGGLLGFWNFDETTGTNFIDSSATLAHADSTGTGFSFGSGKLGGALSHDGSSTTANVTLPSTSIQPSSVTMSTWVNLTTFNAWDSICSYYANGSNSWGPFELYTDGNHAGSFYWSVLNGGTRQISTFPSGTTFSTGTWYHVVGTYNSSTGDSKIYVNGVEKGSGSFTSGAISYTTANTDNKISCFNSGRFSGEGMRGALDHVKIFNRALTADEVKAEYDAQNAGNPSGLSLGTVTPGASNTALVDVIVRTDAGEYGVTVLQDHNLQKGGDTISAISGSIASPAAWSEGTTKGLGFTLISAPSLDSKWSSGANYAAFPGTATSFYTRSGHSSSDTIDTLAGRLRLDTTTSQVNGLYSNTVTYTGTTLP